MRRSLQLALSLLAASVMLLGATATSEAHATKTTVMKVKPAHIEASSAKVIINVVMGAYFLFIFIVLAIAGSHRLDLCDRLSGTGASSASSSLNDLRTGLKIRP